MRSRRMLIAVIVSLLGCAAATSRLADTTYMGQQIRCVQENATREAIDRCREDVRNAWRVSDGGADADADVSDGGDGHDR